MGQLVLIKFLLCKTTVDLSELFALFPGWEIIMVAANLLLKLDTRAMLSRMLGSNCTGVKWRPKWPSYTRQLDNVSRLRTKPSLQMPKGEARWNNIKERKN